MRWCLYILAAPKGHVPTEFISDPQTFTRRIEEELRTAITAGMKPKDLKGAIITHDLMTKKEIEKGWPDK